MPRRKTLIVEEAAFEEKPIIKKPRGRPRKVPIDIPIKDNVTSLKQVHSPDLIAFIKNGISLMRIRTYK